MAAARSEATEITQVAKAKKSWTVRFHVPRVQRLSILDDTLPGKWRHGATIGIVAITPPFAGTSPNVQCAVQRDLRIEPQCDRQIAVAVADDGGVDDGDLQLGQAFLDDGFGSDSVIAGGAIVELTDDDARDVVESAGDQHRGEQAIDAVGGFRDFFEE